MRCLYGHTTSQLSLCCRADLYNNLKVVFIRAFGPTSLVLTSGGRLQPAVLHKHAQCGVHGCVLRAFNVLFGAQGREIGQASSSDANADSRCKTAALNGTLRRCCGF